MAGTNKKSSDRFATASTSRLNGYAHFDEREAFEADFDPEPAYCLNGQNATNSTTTLAKLAPIPAGELADQHPVLRPVVVDGICRRGEVVNIIAASKAGKSWLAYSLLFSVATGRPWLDTFPCVGGKALLLDNELHAETLAHRLRTTAAAMGVGDGWREAIDVLPLRGRGVDLDSLAPTIQAIESGEYRLVVADAFYRFLPAGADENSNACIARLYNTLDAYADSLQAAWLNIHHSSKGDQSAKAITDVGAGAGSQSRAADAHIIMRPHEHEGVVVLEAANRSFPPLAPLAIRWQCPLWVHDASVDPRQLKRPQTATERERTGKDRAARAAIVAELAGGNRITISQVRKLLTCGKDRAERVVYAMLRDGEIVEEAGEVRGNKTEVFRLADPA